MIYLDSLLLFAGHEIYRSKWTWVVEEIWTYANGLRSTLKLCRPAYFVKTTQLLPHPGLEYINKSE